MNFITSHTFSQTGSPQSSAEGWIRPVIDTTRPRIRSFGCLMATPVLKAMTQVSVFADSGGRSIGQEEGHDFAHPPEEDLPASRRSDPVTPVRL